MKFKYLLCKVTSSKSNWKGALNMPRAVVKLIVDQLEVSLPEQ